MGMSKQDMAHKKAALKKKLAELELKAKDDPLKRNRVLHEEIIAIKKKLANE